MTSSGTAPEVQVKRKLNNGDQIIRGEVLHGSTIYDHLLND